MFIAKTFLFVEKTATKDDLEKINLFTRRELTAEEVYSFSIRLCDDQPDRDFERFTVSALQELSKLFIGKSGLFDHRWSAHEQTARIYDTSVERCGNATCLMAKAYLLKTPENEALIASIDGGILKEVSVGCAIKRAACSICGESYGACDHRRGSEYDGEICYVELSEAVDAYEFSFVAVPAQPMAGVVKGAEGNESPAKILRCAQDDKPEGTEKKMSVEEAERAKARLRLENLRFGG